MHTDGGCFVHGCSSTGREVARRGHVAVLGTAVVIKAVTEVKGQDPWCWQQLWVSVSRTLTSSLRTPNKVW